jgi:RimJ/RimL family protein N-acetyltransferase
MMLVNVEKWPDAAKILYEILTERAGDVNINISHKPESVTYESHKAFVDNHPYAAWYLIIEPSVSDSIPIGSIYLTKPPRPSIAGNEIGIFLRKQFRGMGFGEQAVRVLMDCHGAGRYLANINPANDRSIGMFEAMGFKHCQNTYELIRK